MIFWMKCYKSPTRGLENKFNKSEKWINLVKKEVGLCIIHKSCGFLTFQVYSAAFLIAMANSYLVDHFTKLAND